MEQSTQAGEYGFIRDGKVYLKGFLDFPERQIGEVKDTEEAALAYFIQRFDIIKKKVEGLVNDIDEAQNKGSFLMKLLHLREQLGRFDAIGDFAPLYDMLQIKEDEIQTIIAKNREKNLEIKRALVSEAEQLQDSVDWKETAEKFKELKAKWLKTGAVEKEYEQETELKFNGILDSFFLRRKSFFEDKNKLVEEKIVKLEAIIQKAKDLIASDDVTNLDNKVKELQEEWQGVGSVPSAKSSELWKEFKTLKATLLKKSKKQKNNFKANKKGGREDFLQTNLKIKQQLCEEAKALAQLPNQEALERAKTLQSHWKETGPVPDEHRKVLTESFTTACDRIFETNYLLRVVHAKNHNYRNKTEKEQLNVKIAVLKDLIRKDEGELEIFENNFGNLNMTDQNLPMNKLLHSKLNSQKRKLQVKQQMLAELQEELKNM
jgi:hypothetical protein